MADIFDERKAAMQIGSFEAAHRAVEAARLRHLLADDFAHLISTIRNVRKAGEPEISVTDDDVESVLEMLSRKGQDKSAETLDLAEDMLSEVVTYLAEEFRTYKQVLAQLAEVDEIIVRLGRDREEIDRLKEETRSNISELQRMIAA